MYKAIFRFLIAIIIPIIGYTDVHSQALEYRINLSDIFPLHDFELDKSKGLSVVALNEKGEVDANIEGIYTFVINGYIEKVKFNKGIASISKNFEGSNVFYVKHEREINTLRHLYYSIDSFAIRIPLWLFILIPVVLLLFAMFIKRILFILLFVGFISFFLLQGLNWGALISLIKETFQYFGS